MSGTKACPVVRDPRREFDTHSIPDSTSVRRLRIVRIRAMMETSFVATLSYGAVGDPSLFPDGCACVDGRTPTGRKSPGELIDCLHRLRSRMRGPTGSRGEAVRAPSAGKARERR